MGAAIAAAPFVMAKGTEGLHPTTDALSADVIFLGEQHDNSGHHAVQAAWVATLQPRALVFEMLTEEQADRATPVVRHNEDLLESAFGWEVAGWPDFSMYFPIFAAAPDAEIVGAAVPRAVLGDIMQRDISAVLAPEQVARFELDAPLPDAQQEARQALQRRAHCDALPEEFLPKMVMVQRVRDASLAAAAADAFRATGGPVVVITGNGHARQDWGAPFLLQQAEAGLKVFALGQGEDGSVPEGMFEIIVDGPSVDRGDPCDAFK